MDIINRVFSRAELESLILKMPNIPYKDYLLYKLSMSNYSGDDKIIITVTLKKTLQ